MLSNTEPPRQGDTMTGLCDLPVELLLMIYSHIPTRYSGKRILNEISSADLDSATAAQGIMETNRRDRATLVSLAVTCKRLNAVPLEPAWREINLGIYAENSQEAVNEMLALLWKIRKHPTQFSSIRKLFIYVDEKSATPADVLEDTQEWLLQTMMSSGFRGEVVTTDLRSSRMLESFRHTPHLNSEVTMATLFLTILLQLPHVEDLAHNVSAMTWNFLLDIQQTCLTYQPRIDAPDTDSQNGDNENADLQNVNGEDPDAKQIGPKRRVTGHGLKLFPLNTLRSFSIRNQQPGRWRLCNRFFDCTFPFAPEAEVYNDGYDYRDFCATSCKSLVGKMTPNLTSIVTVNNVVRLPSLRRMLSDCQQLIKFIYVAPGDVRMDLTAGEVIEALEGHAKTLRTICIDCRSQDRVHPIKSLESFTALENLWLPVDSFLNFKDGGACDPAKLLKGRLLMGAIDITSMCRRIREMLPNLHSKSHDASGGESGDQLSDYAMIHPAFQNLPASLKRFHLKGQMRFLLSDLVSMWEQLSSQYRSHRVLTALAIDLAAQDEHTELLLRWGRSYGCNMEFNIDPLPHLW